MPQQSLSDFVSAMEAAGMLVRITEEKRVDELPRVMEDHPTTAVLVQTVTGCAFSFLANAYSNQDQYAWAMGCKKAETGMKMVEASKGRIAPVIVDTAPCKEVILTGDDVDMTILPMFLHHERDGQSYSDDNLVISKDPDTGVYDWGFYRSMFRTKNERGFDMTCTSHRARINAQKAAAKGQNLEIAVVIGAPIVDKLPALKGFPPDVNGAEQRATKRNNVLVTQPEMETERCSPAVALTAGNVSFWPILLKKSGIRPNADWSASLRR
jgi:2,5-furandicarboxylate decarboxylase 1